MSQHVFEVEGQVLDVVKKGYAQAKQVTELGQWLTKHGGPAITLLTAGINVSTDNIIETVSKLVGYITPEAMVDLFATVYGCTREFANENFDISLLVEGAVGLYQNQPAISKLVSRFFSVTPSIVPVADNSTPSEPPTDTPTIK